MYYLLAKADYESIVDDCPWPIVVGWTAAQAVAIEVSGSFEKYYIR